MAAAVLKIVEMPVASTYGAVEIKGYIKKNTYRAFIITVALFLAILLLYWLAGTITAKDETAIRRAPVTSKIDLTPPPTTEEEEVKETQQAPTQVTEYSTEAQAGRPVPVEDMLIKEEVNFASMDNIDQSLASKDGIKIDNIEALPDNLLGDKPVVNVAKEEAPGIDDFIAVEEEPYIDLGELQKKIVYPEMARRSGTEGKVIIRVLVGKNGKPQKAVVQESESSMLDEAAKSAVMSSTFKPAIQNGQPTICWVSIPIVFKLK